MLSQIPENWIVRPARNGFGTRFLDPINGSGNNVRVMNGKPNSQFPSQQQPYVKQTQNGSSVDVNGNNTTSGSPDAHIPKDQFRFDNGSN